MKNYKDSDYALNRYSEGIVYKFADRTVEITLEDYLTENPGKTAEDFHELKALSDAIYLEQDRAENAQTKKDISIHSMESLPDLGSVPMDEQYIEIQDKQYAAAALRRLLDSGKLTEIQRRRFVLHFIKGLSLREIAEQEKVHFTSVDESVSVALDKLKKFFDGF